jgi:hypothetical protein
LCHHHLKASNVLVTDGEAVAPEPRLWIVDLDGMRRRSFGTRAGIRRMVTRLAASLVDLPSVRRTDGLRFLEGDRRALGGDPAPWKVSWTEPAGAVTRHQRQARRQNGGRLDEYVG